jgi:hypothetical protein
MGISATDTNETIALIDYVEGVDAGIEAGLDGEPPTWDEVPEGRGSAPAGWVGKYPNLFERMCEVANLVLHGGTHTARMVIANRPLLLDWQLLGGLEFSSVTRPRRETHVGAVRVVTTEQPKPKALLISSASIWLCRRFSSRGLPLRYGLRGPRCAHRPDGIHHA